VGDAFCLLLFFDFVGLVFLVSVAVAFGVKSDPLREDLRVELVFEKS
jgi:hypothetical protein